MRHPPPDTPTPTAEQAAEQAVAVAAAEEAGRLLRAGFGRDVAVRAKGAGGDVVTDLDLAAENLLVQRIREHFPHDRILSEEAGALDAANGPRHAPSRTWLVDPLDGSNNVAVGLPVYTVGIGLHTGGRTVLGVVHDPATRRTWTARAGHGAYGPRGRLLPGPARALPPAGPVLAWTQGHDVRRDDTAARALRERVENGSRRLLQLWAPLLAWCLLAEGAIDGFVGYRAESLDLPAGALIAAEAGIPLRHLDGTPFTRWLDASSRDRGFVAGRPELLPYLLTLAGPAVPGTPRTT